MKKISLIILSLSTLISAHAQKLPNVQTSGIKAPANVKIDGKTTEWGKFAAYNSATSLHYTMANDDKNLYLVIQADDPNVLTKITNRGVLLTIHPFGKKSLKDTVAINYPVFELRYNTKPFIRFSNTSGLTSAERIAINSNPDSMLVLANKKLKANDKYIRTSGMADVDTMLSIYNEKGITANEIFTKGPVYNYEIAIPLKYLKLSAIAPQKFSYHIVLNGISVDIDSGLKVTKQPDGKMLVSFAPGFVTIQNKDMPAVMATTDFWGEYTLAK